jgi:type 2 lantibiotic biosynthesis protein LanM
MHALDLHHPSWYRALTLTERLASLRQDRAATRDVAVDAGRAERRLRRWRDQDPFATDGFFARRLAADGMNEDDLWRLLGEPIEAVRDRSPSPPHWLLELDRAFSRPTAAPTSLPEELSGRPLSDFLEIVGPLISQGRDRVREGIEVLSREHGELPFDSPTVERALYESLPGRLIPMMCGTMALELHVSRLRGDLRGDTTEERFRSFLERTRRREHAVALLQEYPVLARQLVEAIDRWVAFGLEFLEHLCTDLATIRDMFTPEAEPGTLTGVAGGKGDWHRGGRSVLIAEFRSGLRLVYKPRDLAVDVHFQELLSWLNERGDHPPFRTLKVLDRGTHGWVEFVAEQACTLPDEVRRFYRRQGGYLALLYALDATDFHYENLVAAGEHPVLVDLEALFRPREELGELIQTGGLAAEAMAQSVLRVGLLPQRFWASDQSEGVDLSGLGGDEGQLTPQPVPSWENAGTDAMQLTRKRVTMHGGRHRPSLDGPPASAFDHVGDIEAGFTELYRLLRDHRDHLLSAEGILRRFAEDETRIILRSTRAYATMLRESFHPDLLRDALDRDRFFDHLWVEATKRRGLLTAFPAERDDLLNGDVPALKGRPGSRALWGCDGAGIAYEFPEPAMATVERRLRQMGDGGLTQQLWIIRASLATLLRSEGRRIRMGSRPVRRETGGGHGHGFLAAARAIGDHLESIAVRDEKEAAWVGLVAPLGECHWSLLPLGLDLYDGHPGVLLFVAYLGALTGEGRYTSLAESALASLSRMIERGRSTYKTIGYASGWGGIIYSYVHLHALWRRPDLLAEADAILERLSPLIEEDDHLDLIGGSAGCIGGLISLYHYSPSPRVLDGAVRCGDHLLSRARTMEWGIAWESRIPVLQPLTGIAHGNAGIAWALGELADLTGEARFRTAERAAVDYERSLFSAKAKNWPDLRDRDARGLRGDTDQASFMAAWCHGASGIGLARLLSLGRLDEPATRAEIEAALETTLARGFGENHALCHGDLGNLEPLLQAGERFGDPRWRAEADRMAASTLESIRKDGWICGVPSGVETPGLMTGLAGIGFGLLRLAEPRRTSSVLALESPRTASWN